MRPIALTLAGLHSFQAPQTIDFRALQETGVFGIFGPTGSGKSSILDAITLALFGEVDRAPRGTQGIINHACDRLTVDFTFELSYGGKRIRYRVQRSYKREKNDPHAARNDSARLLEVDPAGGEMVLASGATEVTRKVEGILGLTAQDFTRAVVLPQGKFAEFLSLGGTERRKMLQRIFGLSRYGDELNTRLKTRLEGVVGRQLQIESEMQGLGDASAEAVERAEQDYRRACDEVALAGQALKTAEERLQAAREVWELQGELAELVQKEQELARQAPAMAELAELFNAAERAEKVAPLLIETEEAEKSRQQAGEALFNAEQEFTAAESLEQSTRERYESAARQKAVEEPKWVAERQRLTDALSLEKEIAEQEQTLAAKRAEYQKANVLWRRQNENLRLKQEEKNKAQAESEKLKTALSEALVSSAKRAEIQAAYTALQFLQRMEEEKEQAEKDAARKAQEYRQADEQWTLARQEAVQAEEKLKACQNELNRWEQERPADESVLGLKAQELERYRALVVQFQQTARQVFQAQEKAEGLRRQYQAAVRDVALWQEKWQQAAERLEQEKKQAEDARAALAEIRDRLAAAHLAAGLAEGQPCPVCGATHHPALAANLNQERLTEAQNRERLANERLHRAQEEYQTISVTLAGIRAEERNRQTALAEAEQDLCQQEEVLTRLQSNFPPEWRDISPDALAGQIERLEQSLAQARQIYQRWEEQRKTLQAELDRVKDEKAKKDSLLRGAESTRKAKEEAWREAEGVRQAKQAEYQAKREAFDQVRGDLPRDQVERAKEELTEKDRLAEEIRLQLTEKEKALADLQRQWDVEQQAALKTQEQMMMLAAEGNELKSRLDRDLAKLRSVVGERSVGDALREVEAYLNSLAEREAENKKAWEQASRKKAAAEASLAAARSSLQSASERLSAVTARLAEAWQSQGFTSRQEAANAVRPAALRAEWRKQLEAYRDEQLKCREKRREVEGRLAGRSLTTAEWDGIQQTWQEAQQVHRAALENKGRREQEWRNLVKKHSRYAELAQKREELAKERDLLQRLQVLLRGNAFVDFMAEEQLEAVARTASARLGQLTKYRYALEVDSEGGFIMRDDYNGGVKRAASSLSGGEKFLTSLALALALSGQIQLKGQCPLEFFFLDEGFGTLDNELLETVMDTLERLKMENMSIGIISHVPELKQRLACCLVVKPAVPGVSGSTVRLEWQ